MESKTDDTDPRIKSTITTMLTNRGYTVEQHSENDSILIASDLSSREPKRKTIVAFTTPVLKFNAERVKEFVSVMGELKVTHSIIVYDTITAQAKSMTTTPAELRMELFHISRVKFDITVSGLVPKHEQLTKAESKAFIKANSSNWSELTYNDAISRYYNYSRGDVIKVTRKSGYVAYRIVK